MARENLGTNIDAGLVARVSAGWRAGIQAAKGVWFGPMEPMKPVVSETEKPSVEGRQFDYPVGFNTRTVPRGGETVTFDQMRGLADGYDLMRLVIESRKDQMASLKWVVKPKDDKAKPDTRCDALNAFFASPDQEHTWSEWLRLLLEDLFVLDAPTLYVRPNMGGGVFAFEAIDGSTIKRVLDERGRTPLAPDPAYQQILKGVAAIDYTREELIYRPRNIRTHKVYGYSPVEQVIMTVNIALRRQLHQLQYYTDGSMPDLIFSVPAEWTPAQTRQFKEWWDGMLAGNTGGRRGTMFVPDGATPLNTKDVQLHDNFDEWLARIICYAFSVSPQAFVKEVNRATAETAVKQAESEGLQPIMQWVKELMDYILVRHFKVTDLEFAWDAGIQELAPVEQANVHDVYLRNKVLTPDEVRSELGREPLTPEERADAFPEPPPPNPPANGNDQQKTVTAKAEGDFAKAKKSLRSTESATQSPEQLTSCASEHCGCSKRPLVM